MFCMYKSLAQKLADDCKKIYKLQNAWQVSGEKLTKGAKKVISDSETVHFSVNQLDFTYVRLNYKWNYICVLVDLFNLEIIVYSAGLHKDVHLAYDAFATVKTDLRKSKMFYSYRVNEFKNELLEKVIITFEIKRSLSIKGCSCDKAGAEVFRSLFTTAILTVQLSYGTN